MRKFLPQLLLYISPVLILLSIYLYEDPFRVLYHYDSYFSTSDSAYYKLNSDYISIQSLIQNHKKDSIDSYIFGSSRADGYSVSEWGKYINSRHGYHLNVAWESLYGIEKKMEFLNNNHYPIKNVLIALDNDILSVTKKQNGHLLIKHPETTGESSFQFQSEFLKDFFLDKDFLFAYLKLISSKQPGPAADGSVLNLIRFSYNARANEFSYKVEDDTVKFYKEREKIFYDRDPILHYSKAVIGDEQKKLLMNIKNMLAKNNTNYRIVVNPLYNQLKISAQDLKTLQNIFGGKYVFDFSGINDFTKSKYNYYETSHFRPRIHNAIMNIIYN